MRRFMLGIGVGFLLATHPIFAGQLAEPPLIQDKQTLLYLRKIEDNWMNLPVVTTAPNGSRQGRIGDMVLLSTGGNYHLEVNISTGSSGGTSWVGEQLTVVP